MCRLLLQSKSSQTPLLLLLLAAGSFTFSDAFVTSNSPNRLAQRAFTIQRHWTAALSSSVSSSSEITPEEDDETELSASLMNTADAVKVTKLESLTDFLEFLAEDDRLCVIKFHADWCKSCQRFGVKYTRLASRLGAVEGPIRFASIEYGSNLNLCRSLGVKKLPTVHIYKGDMGRITQFACGPSKFPMLVDKLSRFLEMSDQDLMFEKKMEEGGDLADSILRDLQKEAASANGDRNVSMNPVSNEVRKGRELNDLWSKLEAKVKQLAED